MKKPNFKNCLLAMLPALFLVFSGWYAYSGEGSVVQIYKNANAPFDEEKVELVSPLPGDIVLAQTLYQGGPFWIQTRTDKLERFKCSQCHNNKEVEVAKAAEMAHGDIVLVHGGKDEPLACFTCHNKDERDFLVTEKGVKVEMDHSYQICGQCHFRQNKDWVGGAHGKRVSHWAGQRVVRTCTSCHDPHSPLFEKRWPATYSSPLAK